VLDVTTREISTPTQRLTATPSPTPEIESAFEVGSFFKENSEVVVALVISFSVLVAGIVGYGRKSL
jgi:hypothetical protein